MEALTVTAFGPSGWPPATSWRKGSGVVVVSEKLVKRWEAVYREYGVASEMVNNSHPGDRAVARHMSRTSYDVAAAWRQLGAEPDMPWWAVAALGAAAQAFEYQGRDWAARAKHDESSTANRPVRQRPSYPVTWWPEETR
jgi:hypothetical protein